MARNRCGIHSSPNRFKAAPPALGLGHGLFECGYGAISGSNGSLSGCGALFRRVAPGHLKPQPTDKAGQDERDGRKHSQPARKR
jgi:hypothetical protein